MRLESRQAAAYALAERLAPWAGADIVVLAIPRGAVPMGRIIADELDAPLDVVLVHKLRDEDMPEVAIGAVSEDGDVALDPHRRARGGWLAQERRYQRKNLRLRRARCDAVHPRISLEGRTAIVVDDGVASGCTMLAALRTIHAKRPRRVIVAVGVAPATVKARLEGLCDEWVSLMTPTWTQPVSGWYEHYPRVTDDEVADCLAGREPVT